MRASELSGGSYELFCSCREMQVQGEMLRGRGGGFAIQMPGMDTHQVHTHIYQGSRARAKLQLRRINAWALHWDFLCGNLRWGSWDPIRWRMCCPWDVHACICMYMYVRTVHDHLKITRDPPYGLMGAAPRSFLLQALAGIGPIEEL